MLIKLSIIRYSPIDQKLILLINKEEKKRENFPIIQIIILLPDRCYRSKLPQKSVGYFEQRTVYEARWGTRDRVKWPNEPRIVPFHSLTKVPLPKPRDSFCSISTSLNFRGGVGFSIDRERESQARTVFEGPLPPLLFPVESETGGRESNLNGPNERTEQITNKASFTVDRLCRQLAKNSTISVVQNSKCDGMMVRNFRMRRRKLLRGGEGEGHLDGNLADSSCRLHRLRWTYIQRVQFSAINENFNLILGKIIVQLLWIERFPEKSKLEFFFSYFVKYKRKKIFWIESASSYL